MKEVETTWFNSSEGDVDRMYLMDGNKIGYMPILQAPAHEFDTLSAVVKRCMHVSSVLGQRYTVITVDQALYCKPVEMDCTRIPGETCCTTRWPSYINVLPEDYWQPNKWIRVSRDMGGKCSIEHVLSGKAYIIRELCVHTN